MEFFIPAAKDNETAEAVYEAAKKHAKKEVGWDIIDRRIYSITHQHSGRNHVATVGKVYERSGEMVIAILESTGTFLICTKNRGIARGMPILIGENKIVEVTEFEHN